MEKKDHDCTFTVCTVFRFTRDNLKKSSMILGISGSFWLLLTKASLRLWAWPTQVLKLNECQCTFDGPLCTNSTESKNSIPTTNKTRQTKIQQLKLCICARGFSFPFFYIWPTVSSLMRHEDGLTSMIIFLFSLTPCPLLPFLFFIRSIHFHC